MRIRLFSLVSTPIPCGLLRFQDRKSTRLNSSHVRISYAVFCLKKKKQTTAEHALSIGIADLRTALLELLGPPLYGPPPNHSTRPTTHPPPTDTASLSTHDTQT